MKETKEILDAGTALLNGARQIMADRKLDMADLPTVFKLQESIPPALQDANKALNEIRNLTPDQVAGLTSEIKELLEAALLLLLQQIRKT